ncbi:pyridoxal-phosphate dependent enzyme [Mesorhizobium atlanticum]
MAYSSGNFAQGLAAAGRPRHSGHHRHADRCASPPSATRRPGYGARVVLTDHGDRAREEVAAAKAREIAETEHLTLLHPFDDPESSRRQAGAGLEALDQLAAKKAHADFVFCSVGGGGLIGGVSLAFHYLSPKTGSSPSNRRFQRTWARRSRKARSRPCRSGRYRSVTG